MICKRCGSKIMYAEKEEYTGLTEIRCFNCDKWIKWATEDEKRVIPTEADVIKAMNANDPQVIKAKYKKIEEIVNSPDYYTLGSLDKIAEVVKG